MRKLILLVLPAIFALMKASYGQTVTTSFNLRYEYHPIRYSVYDKEIEFQNAHIGKIGFVGRRYKFGVIYFEWHPITLTLSSFREEPWGISFTDFVFRTGRGRCKVCLYLDLLEITRNQYISKTMVLHHSIAGGIDLYLSNRLMLTLNAGVTYERNKVFGEHYFSPCAGIGLKCDVKKEKTQRINWDHVIY